MEYYDQVNILFKLPNIYSNGFFFQLITNINAKQLLDGICKNKKI